MTTYTKTCTNQQKSKAEFTDTQWKKKANPLLQSIIIQPHQPIFTQSPTIPTTQHLTTTSISATASTQHPIKPIVVPSEVEHLLPRVKFFAARNQRKKFFITNKQNYFGGFHVPYVMTDTGCNSLLLPIQDGELELLFELFPSTIYVWSIGSSHGVGSLDSIVLRIAPRDYANQIRVILHGDCELTVPFLRFHLCYDDAKDLQTRGLFQNNLVLNEWLIKITQIRDLDIVCAKRRSHALIGQQVLENFACIQKGLLFVMIDLSFPLADWNNVITFLNGVVAEEVENFEEFNDLQDDDHDGDDPDVILYECCCDEEEHSQ